MKKELSKGSIGGVIMIVIALILIIFVCGIAFNVYKSSSTTTTPVPGAQKPATSSSSATTSTFHTGSPVSSYLYPDSAGINVDISKCVMVIDNPSEGQQTGSPIYFSGYLSGCGVVQPGMLIGSVALYDYVTSNLVSNAITLYANEYSNGGPYQFKGYLNYQNDMNIRHGVVRFNHFRPDSSTRSYAYSVYY